MWLHQFYTQFTLITVLLMLTKTETEISITVYKNVAKLIMNFKTKVKIKTIFVTILEAVFKYF